MRTKILSLAVRAIKAEDWEQLSTLGTSKLVRLSYFWMVAIPIIAKVLQGLEPHYDLTVFGIKFPITLTLPFSWVMFYFGSVCFALASAIFAIGCPPTIAKYGNASDFMELENSELAIRQQAANAAIYEQSVGQESRFLANFTTWFCMVEGKSHWNTTIENVISHWRIKDGCLADAFIYVRTHRKLENPRLRNATTLLYRLGFGFFLAVAVQSFIAVVSIYFRTG